MHLVGLPLAQLVPLALVAGAITLLLYLLRLRRRTVPVPFAKLWDQVLREKETTRLFSKLRRLLSLLLQWALLTLLLAALGDPRRAAPSTEGKRRVVLVDASASMKATDVAPSRLEAAKAQARLLVQRMAGADQTLVAQMDASVTPLSTLTDDPAQLAEAVDRVRATDTRADFSKALRFTLDTLRGLPQAEIVVLSDGALGPAHDALGDVSLGNVRLSYVKLGRTGNNVALTQFAVRRYPLEKNRYEVMLETANPTDQPVEVHVSLLGDGVPVELDKVALGPHDRQSRFLHPLSGANRTIEAELTRADGTHDDLPADDHAYALLPERRRVRVQCVTAGNTYLEAALLLDEYLDVTTVAPGEYPAPGTFDVTLFDTVTPAYAAGSGAALYFQPTGDASPVGVGKELRDVGVDTFDKKSSFLRWLDFEPVGIARAYELQPEKSDHVLATSVDETTKKARPLMVTGSRAGHRFAAVGFDPRQSDIVLRVAWPLLLLNAINTFVEDDATYLSSYRTGHVWPLPAPTGAQRLVLTDPAGATLTFPVHDGFASVFGQQAGFFRGRFEGGDTPVDTAFAANLSDLEESSIAPQDELVVDGKKAEPPVLGPRLELRSEVWGRLLVVALVLSALEWFTYHRRVTV